MLGWHSTKFVLENNGEHVAHVAHGELEHKQCYSWFGVAQTLSLRKRTVENVKHMENWRTWTVCGG